MASDGWTDGGVTGTDKAVLSTVAGAQFALRISQHMPEGKKKARFDRARSLTNKSALRTLSEAGLRDETISLDRDNSTSLKAAFSDEDSLGLLITALLSNPIQPFQIDIDDKVKHAALQSFADDLACPKGWVPAVIQSVDEALHTQAALGAVVLKVGMAGLGIATMAAAPFLVLAVAPAALAGGAALVAGLAALGPGGMLGGLAVVSAVAAGGAGVAATSLVGGNRKTVQQNVVIIQAMAQAKRQIRPRPLSRSEWKTLQLMKDELRTAIEQHKDIDDRLSTASRDAEAKLNVIENALKALKRNGMEPSDGGQDAQPRGRQRPSRISRVVRGRRKE